MGAGLSDGRRSPGLGFRRNRLLDRLFHLVEDARELRDFRIGQQPEGLGDQRTTERLGLAEHMFAVFRNVQPLGSPVRRVGNAHDQPVALHRVDRLGYRAGGKIEPFGHIGGAHRRIVGDEMQHLGPRQRRALGRHLPVEQPMEAQINLTVAEGQCLKIMHNMR